MDITFVADDDTVATLTLLQDNSVTFEASTATLSAAPANLDPVEVLVQGIPLVLEPNETVDLAFLLVEIDIKPGSFPNSINLGSGGNVPVAIFSTETFDATTVDPLTVTLASAGVNIRGQGTPQASFEDVDGDGLLDLLMHVETSSLELTETSEQAVLTGTTCDGISIKGSDTVRVVP